MAKSNYSRLAPTGNSPAPHGQPAPQASQPEGYAKLFGLTPLDLEKHDVDPAKICRVLFGTEPDVDPHSGCMVLRPAQHRPAGPNAAAS